MGIEDDIAILAAAPVFEAFERDALRLLTFAAERRSLESGETLFSRGEPADGGFVVLSGTIALAPRVVGGETVLAGRSALIGCLALFVRGERPGDAAAHDAAAGGRKGLAPAPRAVRHRGVRIALVVSTHSHNDMISGERELARVTGAQLASPRATEISTRAEVCATVTS